MRGAAPSGSCRLPPPPAAVATSPTVRCPPRVPARRTAGLIDLMLGRQHARRLVGAAEVVDDGLGQVHMGIGLLGQAQAQLHHLGRLVATWGLWPSPPNRMTRRRRRTRSGQLCPRPGSADTAAEWNPCPPAAGPHCGDRMPNVSCRTHDAHAGLGCHNGRARRPLRTEPRPRGWPGHHSWPPARTGHASTAPTSTPQQGRPGHARSAAACRDASIARALNGTARNSSTTISRSVRSGVVRRCRR